jgi:hypothetical protein
LLTEPGKYWFHQEDFGLDQEDFGLDQEDFGLDQEDFGLDQEDFGLDQKDFGLDQEVLCSNYCCCLNELVYVINITYYIGIFLINSFELSWAVTILYLICYLLGSSDLEVKVSLVLI